MSEDELSALQEQLAEARAENERLQATAADREARALHLDGLNGQLREQLAAAQADLSAGQGELSSVQADLSAAQAEKDDLHARLQAAVGKYREVLLAAAPEVVQEMVAGESIEEVDAAMERARQTVLHVRERLESQAQVGRVPTGSPPRTAPDLSALSPMEKIRLGLGQK
jgi:chromosome segregation ATPase